MSVQNVPLFPLQTVLFPRMPLPLKIFEERYKRMISHCLKEERHFGVVLIKEGVEVGGPAVPERVGTMTRIHAIEPLEGGQYQLFAEGTTRFTILEVDDTSEPYLIGRVEPLADGPSSGDGLVTETEKARALFRDYFDILVQYAGVQMPEYELPDGAEDLSFVVAAVVQASIPMRQSFLEMTDTAARLSSLQELLTADIERLRLASDRTNFVAQQLPAEWRKKFISNN
jgi:Lon protease-like protein